VRNWITKCVLAVILLLNAVCLVLTFERTFWAATAFACFFVVVTTGVRAFLPALKWAWLGMALLIGAAVLAPAHVRTTLERWALVGDVGTDNSFKHRVVESHVVAEAITARPVTGSGFGATVTFGVPDLFPTSATSFGDMGYLWLAWKIGVPAAGLLVLLLLRAVLRRFPRDDTAEWRALRKGSQAAMLALLLIGILFAPFNALGITAAMGLLAAICYSPTDLSSIPSREFPDEPRRVNGVDKVNATFAARPIPPGKVGPTDG
jgi:O-antigen ligase